MNGQLVGDLPCYEVTPLLKLVQDLKAEFTSLRQEVADLRRENLQLRQEAGYRKSMHAAAVVRVAKLEGENEQLRGEIPQLQARLFGQKSEHASSRDRSNHLPGEKTDDETVLPRPRGQQKGRPGPQRRDYSGIRPTPYVRRPAAKRPRDFRLRISCSEGNSAPPESLADVAKFKARIRRPIVVTLPRFACWSSLVCPR